MFKEPSRWIDPKKKLWAVPLAGATPIELLERRSEVLAEDEEESVRLLYVATTRARDLLVVPVIGDERDDKPAASAGASGTGKPRPAMYS